VSSPTSDSTLAGAGAPQDLTSWISGWCPRGKRPTISSRSPRVNAAAWPALIKIARNPNLPRSTRTQSVFWVGQAAGEAATANLSSIVLDNSVDREVRESAVFALSQRPREEGVPALIAVARTNKDPEIRKKALFWLGQSNDPRAIDLFEELLTRK